MSTNKPFLISNLTSLNLWARQLRSLRWTRNLPVVKFQLSEFSQQQNQYYSVRASNLQKACGCMLGGFFMSITVVSLLVSYFTSEGHFSNSIFINIVSFIGLTVLATLSGKLLGLFWARLRLFRLAIRIRNTIGKATHGAVTEPAT